MAKSTLICMQYFEAVRKGKAIASEAQMKMFKAAGFGMLTLTTKKAGGKFVPVGAEEQAAVIRTQDGFVAIITDGDGCTKAQSRASGRDEAFKIFDKLVQDGMPEFAGDAVEIWTERYPKAARD